jgi:hypothetical protein
MANSVERWLQSLYRRPLVAASLDIAKTARVGYSHDSDQ